MASVSLPVVSVVIRRRLFFPKPPLFDPARAAATGLAISLDRRDIREETKEDTYASADRQTAITTHVVRERATELWLPRRGASHSCLA